MYWWAANSFMKILKSIIKKGNGRDTCCATPVVLRLSYSYRRDCESAMTLVGVEQRLTSTDEQDVEVAVAELFQDFFQVRRALVALRRRNDSLVVHRLALEGVVSVREADVPAAFKLALLQHTCVGSSGGNCRRLDRGVEAIILPTNQVLPHRVVDDDLVCRHYVSHWELHGVLPPLKVQISSPHSADNDYRSMIPIMFKVSILRHKSQEAALAASWRESFENFSFLLLQNMVRADVFNGFFCGFERCGSAAFPDFRGGTSSPPQAAKAVRTNSSILHHVGNVKSAGASRPSAATKSYGVFGAKRNSRFR